MPDEAKTRPGMRPWWAVGLVAGAFFHFLIFAQFGFLRRLEAVEALAGWLHPVLLAMGLGGVLGSVWAGKRFRPGSARCWLIWSFAGGGISAAASAVCPDPWLLGAIAFLVGLSLGSLTVSLAPVLTVILPRGEIGRWSGWGVGLAYALANVPAVHHASPETQCLMASVVCVAGILLAIGLPMPDKPQRVSGQQPERPKAGRSAPIGLFAAVGLFLVLIWLDSAAFYSIQHTDALREAGWGSSGRLLSYAVVHFLAALAAGYWLDRGGLKQVLAAALLFLLSGVWWLTRLPGAGAWLMSGLYLAGVSAYSAALVAYAPMGFAGRDGGNPQRRAAWVYAVAGWIGSALGIGMARDLDRVPGVFLVLAPIVFAGFWWIGAKGAPTAGWERPV